MLHKIELKLSDDLWQMLQDRLAVSGQDVNGFVAEAIQSELKRAEGRKDAKFAFIDLFAGIGGMRIAFERVGGQCLFSSEIDKYCRKTYFDNFGVLPDGDITKIDERGIPEHDILVAGFPCQPFSLAGESKKKNLGRAIGFEDKTQGTMFFEICRILRSKRPAAFLLENVKHLRTREKGETFRTILDSLNELDYDVFYDVLDAQRFVPQHRERIFIVGFDRNRFSGKVKFNFNLSDITTKAPVLGNILEKAVDPKYTLSDKLWNYLQAYAEKHRKAGNGFGFGLAPLDGISRTLSARYYKDGSEILIAQEGMNPRRLTPRECARLMGFPEDFKMNVSENQAYHQFGNSVVVPLVQEIAGKIVRELERLGYLEAK